MRLLTFLLLLLTASALSAADLPEYAPAPAWVKPLALPKPGPAVEAPTQTLLLNRQERLDPEGDEYYFESAILVQTPQGLADQSTVSVEWSPDSDTLVVHRIDLRRGGEVIDLLAGGQKLVVLRRETDLENAMLSGVLTGMMQPEGLEVGDILHIAYTLKRRDPVLAGHSNSRIGGVTSPAVRSHIRQIWRRGQPMRWQASRDVPKPVVVTTAEGTELSIDMSNPEPVAAPEGAPARFGRIGMLEASDFADWGEVSRLLAPHYAKASIAGTAVKAEAARIAAAHGDPKARAHAALALVQKRVRYVFLGMNAGGYVPANADQSWTRKFGDCKGKTALLVALLTELGIEATPALVSTTAGDGLDARLPGLFAFDHVIVKATISGTPYWLDGTRIGDPGLDLIDAPAFRWALPVTMAGGTLEALPSALPRRPTMAVDIAIDARGGTTLPVPMVLKIDFAGDFAIFMKQSLDAMPAGQIQDRLTKMFEGRAKDLQVSDTKVSMNEQSGVLTLSLKGKSQLDWQQTGNGRRYLLGDADAEIPAIAERPDGSEKNAPVALPPLYVTARYDITLPDSGKGFTTSGKDIDVTLAGLAIKRETRIDNGRLIMISSARTIQDETPFAEMKSATARLRELARDQVYLRADAYRVSDAEAAAIAAARPGTADEMLARANDFIRRGEYDLAIADMNAVLKTQPDHARAIANRGIANFWNDDIAAASADFDRAAALDKNEFVWMRGRGLVSARRGDHRAAVAAFTMALQHDDEDQFTLQQRADSYWSLKEIDKAVADVDAMLALGGDAVDLNRLRADILIYGKRGGAAIAGLDAVIAKSTDDPALRLLRASALRTLKRNAEAIAEFDRVIALRPSVAAYVGRGQAREARDPRGALADAEAAVALDPAAQEALGYRAKRQIAAKSFDAAVAGFATAIAKEPARADLRFERAAALLAAGRLADALADVEVARAGTSDPEMLNEVCWWKGTHNVALESALADCDAALALKPAAANFHDSRGFVLLRLGRHAEAITSLDRALALYPELTASLFARGVARLRTGDRAGGEADLKKARWIAEDIDTEYKEYGVVP